MENTAKNFALQLGALVSLYASIAGLIMILFGIITIQFPDTPQSYEFMGASMMIRSAIALLLVAFPVYVVLTRMVNNIRRHEEGTYLKLTKWLIYLSLLVGGATMLGDLVMVINSFLNGELTVRFMLKALAFLVVVGSAFVYYLFDARGYWQSHERQSIQYGIAVGVLVIASIVIGFMKIDSPLVVRERNIDMKQTNDLQMMQGRVEEYYRMHGVLPVSIDEAYNGLSVPTASESRSAYRYEVVDAEKYRLCAEFSEETPAEERSQYYTSPYDVYYNWDHGKGEWCYERPTPSVEVPPDFVK